MRLRWKELGIAFLMAVSLWYAVSGSEKVESQIDVRVDYRGLPHGLVVRSGLVNKVSVRVRAPMAVVRTMAPRDFSFNIDLSGVSKGESILPINVAQLPFRSGVDVIEVTPSRITLQVDTVESKTVPLTARIMEELPPDMVAQITFTPETVVLTGPSTLLGAIEEVRVPITFDKPVVPGATESRRLLPLLEGVEAEPAEAGVGVHIGIKRKLVKVTRTVQVNAPPEFGKFIRPDKVSLTVAMPESLAGKAASNKEIKAFVTLEQRALGSYTLPLKVSLPEGAQLVEVDPPHVTVTLEQK